MAWHKAHTGVSDRAMRWGPVSSHGTPGGTKPATAVGTEKKWARGSRGTVRGSEEQRGPGTAPTVGMGHPRGHRAPSALTPQKEGPKAGPDGEQALPLRRPLCQGADARTDQQQLAV